MKMIVVIDDDIKGNQMLCRILNNAGYQVSSAFNGVEGLKMIIEERPDLVITDIYMAEKEGLETIMELRQAGNKVRIMAISGGSPNITMPELLNTAVIFGADAIMAKPLQMETFLGKVKELLDE